MSAPNVSPDPYQLPAQPQLEDLLRVMGRAVRLTVRTHVPAQVTAYNAAQNRVTCTVQHLQVVRVVDATRIPKTALGLDGVPPNAKATLAPIVLTNIPVALPVGSLGGVTWPIAPGDFGLLHVSDRSLAAWLQAGIPTDPILATTHALADSVFYPGLEPDVSPLVPAVDSTATVVRATTQLKLGSNTASASVTKAENLVTALVNAVNASAVGTMDGGATFKTNLAAQLGLILSQIASTKAKVDP